MDTREEGVKYAAHLSRLLIGKNPNRGRRVNEHVALFATDSYPNAWDKVRMLCLFVARHRRLVPQTNRIATGITQFSAASSGGRLEKSEEAAPGDVKLIV
jgi:hypothetical protein